MKRFLLIPATILFLAGCQSPGNPALNPDRWKSEGQLPDAIQVSEVGEKITPTSATVIVRVFEDIPSGEKTAWLFLGDVGYRLSRVPSAGKPAYTNVGLTMWLVEVKE